MTACVLYFELRDGGGGGEAGVFPSSSPLLFKSFVPGDPSVHVAQEGGWMLSLPLL